MLTPSVSFDPNAVTPMWRYASIEDVRGFICDDVAELNRLFKLQAEDEAAARLADRQPDYRIRMQIDAWERTQDAHWSWLKEIQNAPTRATQGPESLGEGLVGADN